MYNRSKWVTEYVKQRIADARKELASNQMKRKASASQVESSALDELAQRIADRVLAELDRRRLPVSGDNVSRGTSTRRQGNYYDRAGLMDEVYKREHEHLYPLRHQIGETDDR